jgi:uncharacterized protein DUF5360
MPGEYAPSAWSEIIAQAAVSPLGISALVILVAGFVVLALFRKDDKVGTRLTIIVLLLLFCGGLVAAAFYNVQPTVTRPQNSFPPAEPAPTPPAAPPVTPPSPPAAPARVDCGTAWSGWIDVGGAVGNPCPSGCSRGEELGQSYRAVGFPPRPQTQHKFQCWRE